MPVRALLFTVSMRGMSAKLNWAAAVKSGLLAGAILLVFPQGFPWSGMSFFSGVVMGRTVGTDGAGPPVYLILLHLILAVVYAIPIAAIVKQIPSWRGILVGGAVGLGLYLLNLACVALLAPALIGGELRPAITHLVFGLFSAGAYKGMARRRGQEQMERHA